MNDQERLSEALEFASNPTADANAKHAEEKHASPEAGALESIKFKLNELSEGLKTTVENLPNNAKEFGKNVVESGKAAVNDIGDATEALWNFPGDMGELGWKMKSQHISPIEALRQLNNNEGDPPRNHPPENFRYPKFEYLDTAFKSLVSKDRREIHQNMLELAVDVYKGMPHPENLDDLRLVESKPTWNELMRNRESRGGEAPVLSVFRLQNGPWYNKKDTQEAITILDLNNGEGEEGQSQFIISKAKFKEGVVPPEIESYGMSKAFTSKELEKLLGNSPVFGRQAADRKWLKGEVTDKEYKEMRRGFWGKVAKDREWDKDPHFFEKSSKSYKRPQFLKDWDESFNFDQIVDRDDAERRRNINKRTVAVEARVEVADILKEQRDELLGKAAGKTEATVKKAEIEIEGTLPLGEVASLSDKFVKWAQIQTVENPSVEVIKSLINANGLEGKMDAAYVFEMMARIKKASIENLTKSSRKKERTAA